MTLWFVLSVMTAAAVFAVLWPLGRARRERPSGSDVAVYADQLAEIDRDRAAGLIGEAEAAAARVEVSRRLLAAADAAPAPAGAAASSTAQRRRRATALAGLILIPTIAGAVYAARGSPTLPAQPLAERIATPIAERPLESLVAQVEAHLESNPEDGRGWEVIAPVYFQRGRFEDAVKARRNAIRLLGATAERETELGEALVAAANGVVTADAKGSFERALASDRNAVKASYYLGVAAEQDGRPTDAAAIWREMLSRAPPGAGWIEAVRQAIVRVGGDPGVSPSGPSAADVAAASQLTPEQRNEMVRGMVARLAERLQQDGSDVEGWLRLVRSYVVLGDTERARAAAADARKALAAEPAKVERIDALVKGLGLEG